MPGRLHCFAFYQTLIKICKSHLSGSLQYRNRTYCGPGVVPNKEVTCTIYKVRVYN